MLVLTRRVGEEIIIAREIRVTLVAIRGERARIGITAPPTIRVDREEIHGRRVEENVPQMKEAHGLAGSRGPPTKPVPAALRASASSEYEGLPAIADFTAAIRLTPNDAQAHYGRGQAYQLQGEHDRAIPDYTEALRLDPDNAKAYRNRGAAYSNVGENTRAIADYSDALRLSPHDAWTRHKRGQAYAHQGNYDEAITDYSEAIRLDPTHARAYLDRAFACTEQGYYEQAVVVLSAEIRLNPQIPWPYRVLAWLWATCPEAEFRNGKKAVQYALGVCELSAWKNADDLDGLAAAYAECGQFDDAIKYEEQALDLASDEQEPAIRNRLEVYRGSHPYRELKRPPASPPGKKKVQKGDE